MGRMSHVSGILDPQEKKGLPFTTISHIFGTVTGRMPELLQNRFHFHHSLTKTGRPPADLDFRECMQTSDFRNQERLRYLRGRTQFSILIEALHAALPKTPMLKSPLQL